MKSIKKERSRCDKARDETIKTEAEQKLESVFAGTLPSLSFKHSKGFHAYENSISPSPNYSHAALYQIAARLPSEPQNRC